MTYEEKLEELAGQNKNLVVMTAENRAAIRNLAEVMRERFIDVGIAEQTMVGAAAGLALRGRIPIVHALATFLTLRAFEFIRTDIGIANLPVKLVGYIPGFISEANGPTHQAVEDISLMRGIPNVKIFCPADQEELVEGLPYIIADRSPWYIRFAQAKPSIKHVDGFSIGIAEVLSDGMDVALLTYGFMMHESWRAREILEANDISVRFINFRTLKPLDETAVLSAVKECSLLVTIEDHFLTGGLYSIISELLLKHHVTANVMAVALDNHWFKPALLRDVLSYEGFTGEQIAAKILAALNSENETAQGNDNGISVNPYTLNFEKGE